MEGSEVSRCTNEAVFGIWRDRQDKERQFAADDVDDRVLIGRQCKTVAFQHVLELALCERAGSDSESLLAVRVFGLA